MPGATPNRGYPYPLGPEPVDVAGDIERLARAIDLDAAAQILSANQRFARLQGDVAIVTTDANGGAGFNTVTPPSGAIGLTLSTQSPALMDVVLVLYAVSGTLVTFIARHASTGVPVSNASVTVHWQVV